ncbi:Anthranilate phosphoribosyltransferase [Buchnera aphidicola (Symydobius americanus)]|uniref:anthranilate phosphoribosyltransferase n=1 Tax=Buchnera aphidicola TaxID=9 RepID=UPI003A69FE76
MHNILKKLYDLKSLTELESYYIFDKIINNQIKSIELTAILVAMKIKKISIEEIIGAIKAFKKSSIYFPKPEYCFSDIVGTGGDGKNNINISTISALVASCYGLKIIKHCNTGISSTLGSSDILNKLNINIHLNPQKSRMLLDKLNICFLFAPQYHPGFKYVHAVRKQLRTRTIFNILGPLLNPSNPPYAIIGVYSKKLLLPFAKVIKKLKYKRVILINSDGTDEMTLYHSTDIIEVQNNTISSYQLNPEDFGIKRCSSNYFQKNNVNENYKITKEICSGNGQIEYENLIAINTAILFKLFGYENLKENTKIILEIIRSGKVIQHINKIVKTGSACKKTF